MNQSDVTHYSCGFLFSGPQTDPRLLLIQKIRPTWQKEKLNGIGGHIEAGETPLDAMVREFREEAGVTIPTWEPVAVLKGPTFVVHFFSSWTDNQTFDSATAMTDEPLKPIHVRDIDRNPVVPNVRFLVPLALDASGIVKPVMLYDGIPQSDA